MQLSQLEHIIRAAGAITGLNRIVVVGSQAILGSIPNPPVALVVSMEADIYPMDDPEKSDLIDGTIGEMSPFHEEFGYYAHGIGPETSKLSADWFLRSVRIVNENTHGVEGICPCVSDLAVSKLAAGRSKDIDFVTELLTKGFVTNQEILSCLQGLEKAVASLVEDRLCRAVPGMSGSLQHLLLLP
jgi:hypothetical protein